MFNKKLRDLLENALCVTETVDLLETALKESIDESGIAPDLGVKAWESSVTYKQREVVAFGPKLFVSNVDNNTNNPPSVDRGDNWYSVTPLTGDYFDIAGNQFATYNGDWSELNNDYNLLSGFVIKVLGTGSFDFNSDGNPISVNDGDIVEYLEDTWVKRVAIEDKADSNYMDIGNMRIQWGLCPQGATGIETVTLPAAFANSTYRVTATARFLGSDPRFVSLPNTGRTNTTFRAQSVDGNGANSSASFEWMAIGLKPQ